MHTIYHHHCKPDGEDGLALMHHLVRFALIVQMCISYADKYANNAACITVVSACAHDVTRQKKIHIRHRTYSHRIAAKNGYDQDEHSCSNSNKKHHWICNGYEAKFSSPQARRQKHISLCLGKICSVTPNIPAGTWIG